MAGTRAAIRYAKAILDIAKENNSVDAVNAGVDKPIGKWFVPLGKYVLVPLSLVALIAGALLGGIG